MTKIIKMRFCCKLLVGALQKCLVEKNMQQWASLGELIVVHYWRAQISELL